MDVFVVVVTYFIVASMPALAILTTLYFVEKMMVSRDVGFLAFLLGPLAAKGLSLWLPGPFILYGGVAWTVFAIPSIATRMLKRNVTP